MTRPDPRVIELARDRPLGRVVDGQRLLDAAVEHGLQGLLHRQVEQGRAVIDDRRVRAQLTAGALVRERESRARWAIASQLQCELDGLELPTAVLKGLAVEARCYDRPGERPSADLDLWLDPTRLDRFAVAVATIDPDFGLLERVQGLVDAGDYQAAELQRDGVAVDLHADAFKLGTGMRCGRRVFKRAVTVTGPDGTHVRALAPEDALVHQVLHLNRDWFRSLLGHVDVARLIERCEPDWDTVWELADREGLTDVFTLGLRAVDEVVPLTVSVPPAPSSWRARVWQLAWSERVRLSGTYERQRYRYRQDLLALLARGRLVETIRGRWRQRLFPPAAVVDDVYPGLRGPYLWRLTAGRVRAVGRRRESRSDARGEQ